jgi:hypothetical protein
MFFRLVLSMCCLQLNPNCLGFRLIVCVGDPISAIISLLSLFGFLESQIRFKLSFLSLFDFFESQTRS